MLWQRARSEPWQCRGVRPEILNSPAAWQNLRSSTRPGLQILRCQLNDGRSPMLYVPALAVNASGGLGARSIEVSRFDGLQRGREALTRIGGSGDGGIDGVVSLGRLGLEKPTAADSCRCPIDLPNRRSRDDRWLPDDQFTDHRSPIAIVDFRFQIIDSERFPCVPRGSAGIFPLEPDGRHATAARP